MDLFIWFIYLFLFLISTIILIIISSRRIIIHIIRINNRHILHTFTIEFLLINPNITTKVIFVVVVVDSVIVTVVVIVVEMVVVVVIVFVFVIVAVVVVVVVVVIIIIICLYIYGVIAFICTGAYIYISPSTQICKCLYTCTISQFFFCHSGHDCCHYVCIC